MKQGTFALITGAGKGFGRALAIDLAKRQVNCILVSLPGEGLEQLARLLQTYGVQAYCYETDLSNKLNIVALGQWVNSNFNVNILINNAGMGGSGSFIDSDIDYIDSVIRLNITATSLVTHQLLPNLMKQADSYILSVSSLASFSPMGFKTVYPATKRFIQHFSKGLREELKDSSIFVSVVHPGPMSTNADVSRRILKQGMLARLSLVSPEVMAEKTLTALFNRHSQILVGWWNYFYYLLTLVVPLQIRLPIVTNAVKRELAFGR